MDRAEIRSKLETLESESFPGLGRFSRQKTDSINGKKIEVKSRWNCGRSGKGYTSLFYIDGKRVAKSKLVDVIAS